MGLCDVPVISNVCDTAGEAAASLISAPFDWLAQAMGAAAGWLFEAVWAVFDTTTLVDVTSEEYLGVYNIVFGIAVFVMLLFFCLQLITGLIRRDPGALTRAALGLAKSVLGSFIAVTLTALLLEVVDQLSLGIIQAAGETTESMGNKIAALAAGLTAINIAAPGVGAIITIFMAGLAISAAAIVWLSLLVRKALILVAVVLAPLAFAGASWDASKGWIGKWAMFVIALAVSKLVLTVMFLVAITQVSAPIEADLASVSDPLAGVVLMLMAAFAPYMTYRFLSFVGVDMYHSIGAEQEAKQSLNRPVPTPNKPQGEGPKKVLDGNSDPASGGPGGQKPTSGKPSSGPPPSGPGGPGATAGSGTTATGGGTAGAGAGGGAAAGGPAAAAVIGAKVAKDSATAGPKAGQALGNQAETAADAADTSTRGGQRPGQEGQQPRPSGGPSDQTPRGGGNGQPAPKPPRQPADPPPPRAPQADPPAPQDPTANVHKRRKG
ncbi:type IV secretion system protein [Nesterenkonia salmonea]|uniref:Type IV secretion system protein n=1 Tax=Nesterenkonia salmonea TaxID=1804987 RepID=A0A5R9B7W3_9MICC|nr:type IV secretion system protein [Nesterenkonia salmonea]TLP93596.1 type IV secretion system protein [Nesterenkonia salmonea]